MAGSAGAGIAHGGVERVEVVQVDRRCGPGSLTHGAACCTRPGRPPPRGWALGGGLRGSAGARPVWQHRPMAEIADAPSVAEVTAALTAPGQLFEMEDLVIRGIPTRTWKHAPSSLRAVLEGSRVHGETDFLVYEDDHLSFDGHFRAAATLARRLVEDHGVRPGDRVAIAMRNFPEWSVAFWAAASVGAVVVPLNAWWTGPELEYGLADSGSVVLFCRRRAGRAPPRTSRTCRPSARRSSPRPRSATPAGRCPAVRGRGRRGRPGGRAARAGHRSRGRRHDLLHLGHDRPAEGRPRHPPQHLHQPDLAGLRAGARGACRRPGRRARPHPRRRARTCPCCPSPSSTPPVATRSSSANLAFGGKIVIMRKWDAGAGARADRARARHHLRRRAGHGLAGPGAPRLRRRRDISSVRSIGYGGAPAAAGARAAHRGALPRPDAEQRLRPHGDVVGHDAQRRRGLPAQAGLASACPCRCVDVKVVDGDGDAVCPRARSASCGSRAPTS